MSPLWRDEVAIYLAPRKLALVRRSRGPRPRVVAEAELALAVPVEAYGELGPVLSLVTDVLAEPTWQRAAARVVVADHPWARYAVVPWPAARLDAAARLSHARCVLADAHGEGVADWAVTVADAAPGRSYVACAMPAALREGLEDALAPARLALVSLQPELVVSFNAWRHLLPADDAWFVSVEDGSLAAAHLRGGAWDRVHTARLSSDWTLELQRLAAFDRLTRTGAAGRTFVDAPAWMRRGGASGAGVAWLGEGDGGARTHQLALLERMYA